MGIAAPSDGGRAVVTGASRGIGLALATELAARGHHLIVTARNQELLEKLAARLSSRCGVAVEVRGADLTDSVQRGRLAEELAAREISVLCANAGGTALTAPVARLDPASLKAEVQLGAHDLVVAALPGQTTQV